MSTSLLRMSAALFLAVGVCVGNTLVVKAQAPAHAVAAVRKPTTTSQENVQAERDQIWNSADMLRARAWLKDYCSKSAKVTPEMAKQYESELANMSPNQMRLYLMKFDEEEQQRQQQYAMFQQANTAGLQQAVAAHKQTQKGYAAMNQAETGAAQGAEQQISQQRENEQLNAEDREPGTGLYPSGYYNGPYGYGGGIQYHYHLYQ